MTDRRDLHRKRILPPPEPAHKISSLVTVAASANAGTVTASAEAISAAEEVAALEEAGIFCYAARLYLFGWLLDRMDVLS